MNLVCTSPRRTGKIARLCEFQRGGVWSDIKIFVFRQTPGQRRKKRTLPPPKENILENFSWAQRKTFQPGGRYKNPMKTRQAISTTEIFPLWAPFLRQRQVPHWSRAVYAFLFPAWVLFRCFQTNQALSGVLR